MGKIKPINIKPVVWCVERVFSRLPIVCDNGWNEMREGGNVLHCSHLRIFRDICSLRMNKNEKVNILCKVKLLSGLVHTVKNKVKLISIELKMTWF